jgi:HK97 family phage major capsid protein
MHIQSHAAIVLRKVGGRLTACWSSASRAIAMPSPAAAAPSLLGLVGAFALFLALPLLLLGAAVFLISHPTSLASHSAPSAFSLAFPAAAVLDVKALKDDIMKAVNDMREANDERIKQLETKGTADPLLVAKVDKANGEISALTAQLAEVQANLRIVENDRARYNAKGTEKEVETLRAHTRAFLARVRGVSPRKIEVNDADVESFRKYEDAFDSYLRLGDKAVTADIKAALQVGSDPAGGYFVTPAHEGRIAELVFETTPMRQLATVETIGTDAMEGDYDLDEAASGWVGETGARTETNTPTLGQWRIPVFEQYAAPKLSQKQLDDSNRDVGGWLDKKVSNKFSRVENASFVSGDGINKPRGILTYPAGTPTKSAFGKIAQQATGVSGGFAAAPNGGDAIIDLVFGLKAAYRQAASFLMARNTVAAVRKLKDNQGEYIWQPDFTIRQNGTLLGFPIAEGEDMPQIAAASLSIAFGNFAEGYQIVDHAVGSRTLRDPFTNKPWVIFYTTKRVGGDVVNFEAIRLLKFS